MYDPPFWKPLMAIIWLKYCRNVLHGRLKVECIWKKNIIILCSSISVKDCMNERILCTCTCMHWSKSSWWSNVLLLSKSRGQGREHSFVMNLGLLTRLRKRETFEKYHLPPTLSYQQNLKSRGTLSGTIYVTGRYSAGAHHFSGIDSYSVCIARRSCSSRGVCRGHITTRK